MSVLPLPAATEATRRDVAGQRLLILSYYFPPDDAVGGLRWAGLSRHLAALGWNVCVLTARATIAPPGVTLETCAPGPTVGERLLRVRRLWRGRTAGLGPGAAPASPGRTGVWSGLQREIRSLLWVANEGRGWVLAAARRARALIRRLQPDVIVSTGPPHGAHLAAWLATRGTRVRWFVDLRDPFVRPLGRAWRSSELWSGRLGPVLAGLEERVWIQAATGVLAATRETAAALAAHYPGLSIAWAPNGVDRELLPPRSPDPFPGLSIAHVGWLYGGRRLRPVLVALRRFLDRHPMVDGRASLRLVGPIEAEKAEELRRDVAELRLEGHVHVLGQLPRAEALRLLSRSRLAIVLAQDQEYQVPAKLYEPVGMGITTMVVAEADSASGHEARRIGAIPVAPDDIAGMARVFEAIWAEPNGSMAPSAGHGAVDYRALATQVSALLAGEGL